jgi:hypothetical protein
MAADWIVANRFYAPREAADGTPRPAAVFAETAAAAPAAAAGLPPIPPPVPPPAPPVPLSGAGT